MTFEDRRRFIGMSLAAASCGFAMNATAQSERASASAASVAARPTYLVMYWHGPRWVVGKPMVKQQGMREHFLYYLALYRKGQLRSGGGFTDDSGGAAMFEADDDDAAAAFIATDPAVVSGVFRYELKRWRQNPWADISKARAARGE